MVVSFVKNEFTASATPSLRSSCESFATFDASFVPEFTSIISG